MADPRGFLKTRSRELPPRRPVAVRLMDWKEVYEPGDATVLRRQAGRCMDCGIPFCHQGCPLGNLIPEWNDLVRRGEMREASERLHATNNFPEFTGRLCPAPCESSCVLGISQEPVTIKLVEQSIIDEAWANDAVQPHPPERLTGKTVAVVGSGPAGLAAAQQLTRAGHTVAVFERDDRIGGLLRYGIPDFKLEKKHIENRLRQMQAEGTRFRAGVNIGVDITWAELRRRYDAVVVATGALVPRDLPIPGRDLAGVHFAMDYLVRQNHLGAGDTVLQPITAEGRHVIILGGGDTGADCLGTAHRQGALSVTTLAIGTQPPAERQHHQPWPTHPLLFEISSAHEEGGEREFLASTVEFLANEAGEVSGIRVAETEYVGGRRIPKSGTERVLPADLVLLALGFTGTESETLESELDIAVDGGTVVRGDDYQTTEPGMFVAGDAGRGQSLIVWAIAEGRSAAAAVDRYLEGDTELPAPVRPTDRALSL
ncbi:glutamate synthase (NADPH/NADH) small chain [Cryobacterium mesophilum]|uniref:Glutamate synthase subunit beta n=1 Tax=Terrimesophilobacter mesophilus TaxID=433647 RepID=A0A4R8V9Z1_9MICO|nr:glutamate synthase subunit beta [Terrimesophilobacter mesophilus]MBB5631905.1 glutamate synthase (NADPH/NADH) small chain [Terrimesophilobacter mesophilus]TFB78812.1 glutamate synthase subunit beta [Terrimesophilobacter mesophilus]